MGIEKTATPARVRSQELMELAERLVPLPTVEHVEWCRACDLFSRLKNKPYKSDSSQIEAAAAGNKAQK